MQKIDTQILKRANREAIYNIYPYLSNKVDLSSDSCKFSDVVSKLRQSYERDSDKWSQEQLSQLEVLEKAIEEDNYLAESVIGNQIHIKNGLNVCTFTDQDGTVSVVFRGTGDGEWIDNGEGLSGIPEENIYFQYDRNGDVIGETVIQNDYATDQQVEALNWFNKTAAQNGWDENTNIIISGHSKGGNKAQFITANSDLVDQCYNFNGQGFSQEALVAFQKKYGENYEKRRQKIYSFSAYNDYVNVLGTPLVLENQRYFLKAPIGDKDMMKYHNIEAMLDKNGKFNEQCEQGDLSEYVQKVSESLMELPPSLRQYATLGIMNFFQRYIGKAEALNGDSVTAEETVMGLGIAIGPVLGNLLGTGDGYEALEDIIAIYGDDALSGIEDFYNSIGNRYGKLAEASFIIMSSAVVAVAAPFLVGSVIAAAGVSNLMNALNILSEKIQKISMDIYEKTVVFYTSVLDCMKQFLFSVFHSRNVIVGGLPLIQVDTGRLRFYADSLENIKKRTDRLDRRIKSFCLKNNLQRFSLLQQANIIAESNLCISNCIRFLNETADDFDITERKVVELFSEM